MSMLEFSLTAAGNDLTSATSWKSLEQWLGNADGSSGAVSNSPSLAPQALSIQCTSPTNGASATFAVAWVKEVDSSSATVIKYNATGTITATTRRTAKAGASGDYVCDVQINSVTNGLLDLQPYGEDKQVKVYIGLLTIGSGTSFDFKLNSTRAV